MGIDDLQILRSLFIPFVIICTIALLYFALIRKTRDMNEKCNDNECPRRNECKRFTEPPEPKQKYFEKSPRWLQECDMFFSNGTNLQEQREELVEERQSFIRDVMN